MRFHLHKCSTDDSDVNVVSFVAAPSLTFYSLFYRTSEPEKTSEQDQQLAEFDELGKSTLQSQEACSTLIEKLQSAMEERGEDVELLWRLARALVHLSMHHQQNEEAEEEKQLLKQATEHAQRALELNDESWQAHQWYAVSVGSVVKYEGTQGKINGGHEYKVCVKGHPARH